VEDKRVGLVVLW